MDYEFIFNEIMAHPALCVHLEPKKVLILGDGLFELENEIRKHSNVEVVKCESLDSVKDSDYNIIYTDDEQEVEDRNTLHTLLTDDGICVFHGDTWDSENFNEDLKSFDKFRFVIPFEGEFIFASKKWHPTADVRLQAVDMLDGLDYYNSDIHLALFAMPNYVYKNLKKDLKL
ncbi:MAG: hypothetical protein OIF32_00215 [Campylobacterales bacterium]|nr:hypothetical protein [Campylobacterales bacterium]